MLGWLTRKQRWRVASLLVALYALCLVAPTAAMAVGHGSIPEHCLAGDHDTGVAHVHHEGLAHHHSGGKAHDSDHDNNCCGLFGVTAIAPEMGSFAIPPASASKQPSLIVANLTGRGSDRIDRPPRSPQSL